MSQAPQHSDLLFDFGPRGIGGNSAPVTPAESRAFDAQVNDPLPTFDLASEDPLPDSLPPANKSGVAAGAAPTAAGGFWLEGDALMCGCVECKAPMSVRTWLMIADCWNCGVSIELSEEQIREAERVMERRPTPPPSPKAPPPPATPVAPAAKRAEPPPPAPPPATAPARPRFREAPAPVPPPTTTKPSDSYRWALSNAPAVQPVQRPAAPPPPPRTMVPHEEPIDWRSLFHDMPAWLLSFIIHLALLMLLALIQRPHDEHEPLIVLSATVSTAHNEEGDVVHIPKSPDAQFDLPLPNKADLDDPQKREALVRDNQQARELRLDPNSLNNHLPSLDVVKQRVGTASGVTSGLVARDPRLRVEMVQREGGTTLTEAAVARSLRWFQRHQHDDGHWSLNGFRSAGKCSCGNEGHVGDDTAGTSLALLPYLGAGQSHLVGIYQEEVAKGLRWLIKHQQPDGDLRVAHGNSGMYAHGQATIVLCEAFAITGDEELRAPAQKAVDFIVNAQYHDGGWRYTPKPAAQQGDTSVVGWQLMALQSARAANLNVPEQTFTRANRFLDSVAERGGSQYGYQARGGPSPTMTAEGLLCRLYLGWTKDERGLGEGVRYLLENHPPRRNELGIYYWYYATQTMHHYGGREWEQWNQNMRDVLVETQQKEGHAAGSWSPVGQHSEVGGRIYQTALSACTLEVYYRHLPIFRQIKVD
jgi:hypothetical protein